MIPRAIRKLKNGPRHRVFLNDHKFLDSHTTRRRVFWSNWTTNGSMARQEYPQSTLLAGGLQSDSCKLLFDLSICLSVICPNMPVALDPHSYTSGRWLRRDMLERDSRYIEFDFEALCTRVIELCPDAASITKYEKMEGGFNRVFIFTLNNARRVVARLPTRITGPPKLTTKLRSGYHEIL